MKQDWRGQALAACLLVLVGFGGGMGIRAWRAGRPAAARPQDGSAFAGAKLSDAAARLWGRVLGALGVAQRRFGVNDLAALLKGHERDAVARAFAADFQNDPTLMDIWDEWRRAGEGTDSAWLLRRLTDSRSFAELLNRYSSDARFEDLAASLEREIQLAGAQRELPGGKAARGGAAALRSDSRIAVRPPVGAQAGASLALATTGPEARRAATGVDAAGAADAGGDRREAHRLWAQEGAHNVDKKLKELKVAGPSSDIFRFLESLFETMDKPNRDALTDLCAVQGVCEPAAACGKTQSLWLACQSACARNPKCELHAKLDGPWPGLRPTTAAGPDGPGPGLPPTTAAGPEGDGEGSGDECGCPGACCDQCSQRPDMPGCHQFSIDHPNDYKESP